MFSVLQPKFWTQVFIISSPGISLVIPMKSYFFSCPLIEWLLKFWLVYKVWDWIFGMTQKGEERERVQENNNNNYPLKIIEVNIPQSNNWILIYIQYEVIWTTLFYLNICWGKPFKVDLIEISNHKFTLAILFCLDHTLFTPWVMIIVLN